MNRQLLILVCWLMIAINSHGQRANNKPISMNDFDFIAPEGWQVQTNSDHLLIQNPQSGCSIRMLPQPSSGSLEKDANAVFDLMYSGWQYQKSGAQKYVLRKGILPKGLEFFMKEAAMSATGTDGRYYLEEGGAMVVRAGAQIAIISVRHNSSMMAHDNCWKNYNTWKRFFNSFTIKGAPAANNPESAATRIIGAWSQTESGASSEYVFAANGNYAFYGAIGSTSTSRDYNYEYLHIKTYAFHGDGSYSVAGNQLVLKKRGSNAEQLKLRFEKVNHAGNDWADRLCLTRKDSHGENEVCFDKKEK